MQLLKGENVVKNKLIYKTKFKLDGSIDKHKARIVAKGYSPKEGINYRETLAPIEKISIVRTIIVLATCFKQSLTKWMLKIHF